MAAHASSQNAPDLFIPEATHRSSQLRRHEVDKCHHRDLGGAGDDIRDRMLCPRRARSGRASRHARTRGVLNDHSGHAAGAVHTVPEHHASQHADHHSQPRKIATRGSRTASPPLMPITVRPRTRS